MIARRYTDCVEYHDEKIDNTEVFDKKIIDELTLDDIIMANKKRVSIDKMDINLSEINSKIKGYIDSQTNVNIIHFSCYDDAENIINTTDLNLSKKMYEEIYNFIFITSKK